mgnify:CR=1 FL=1
MLILRRKGGESLVIGDQISVTILSVDASGTVMLGINAPKDVLILRSELQQAASVNLDSANVDCVKLVEDLEKSLLHPDPSSCVLCSIPDLCMFLLMSTMFKIWNTLLPQRVEIWVMYPCNRYSSKSMFTGFVPIGTASCLGAPNPY